MAVDVSSDAGGPVEFELNGTMVSVSAGASLLDALRDELAITSPKDGCSPQGQCGCCTVWVDGSPRISCVTPIARVRGRRVTTLEGLTDGTEWADRFSAHGASQCGFCTPGIIMRLAALAPDDLSDATAVRRSLLGHLCRCTGWQPIVDAAIAAGSAAPIGTDRDHAAADQRASIEGRTSQRVGTATALGRGGFADDERPADSAVALRTTDGEWRIGPTLAAVRRSIGKVQGRRTTTDVAWPVEVPTGTFDRVLQTTWVEPAYLEPDASWCHPGEPPADPIGNGGAFGGKQHSPVAEIATALSAQHRCPVRVLYSREDVVRYGPKRPPLAIGMNRDGTGVVMIGTTGLPLAGLDGIAARWPKLRFETVDVAGPPVSLDLRAAVEAELLAVSASFQSGPEFVVSTADGASARATVDETSIEVAIECGDPLDETILASYCVGAAHMAYSMVTSEALRLRPDGDPADLTIRSFGIVRAIDTPTIRVEVIPSEAAPINGSDAVFAAVLAATWVSRGTSPRWPVGAEPR